MLEKMSNFFPLQSKLNAKKIEDVECLANDLVDQTSDIFQSSSAQWKLVVKDIASDEKFKLLIKSMLFMSQICPALVSVVLVKTTAEGTLMKRKLKHVTEPIFEQLEYLLS